MPETSVFVDFRLLPYLLLFFHKKTLLISISFVRSFLVRSFSRALVRSFVRSFAYSFVLSLSGRSNQRFGLFTSISEKGFFSLEKHIFIHIFVSSSQSLPQLDVSPNTDGKTKGSTISSDVEKIKKTEYYQTISSINDDVIQQKAAWV